MFVGATIQDLEVILSENCKTTGYDVFHQYKIAISLISHIYVHSLTHV